MTDIKIIRGLLGRTITDAATDGETMSLVLDNGGILQIAFIGSTGTLHYEIEFAPPTEGDDPTEFMAWWKDHPQYPTYGEAINHFYDDMAQHMDEQSLDYFNRYISISGDR